MEHSKTFAIHTSVDLIAHGDSQVTHGQLADLGQGVDGSPGFVSKTPKFAIAPQFAQSEPFARATTVPIHGSKVRIDDYLTDSERRKYKSDVETFTRAQQMGNQAVGRRLFRRKNRAE